MKLYIRFFIFGITFLVTLRTVEFFLFTGDSAKTMSSGDFFKIVIDATIGIFILTLFQLYWDSQEKKKTLNEQQPLSAEGSLPQK